MKIINIGILAHVDAGKTTLTESLLYASGAISEPGSVEKGTTRTDTMFLERQRGITIQAAVTSFQWHRCKVNIVDTPGHMDFLAEVYRSLAVLDGAILVISAKDGVQAQTRILFHALRKMNIPTVIFINKIDQAGVDLQSVGTGKSYLAGCIANALMEKEIPVYMTNFALILNDLAASFENRNEYISRLCRYPLLILDDFGMERGTEYGLEQVFNVIDSRYRSGKPLIVTTNLTLDDLRNPEDTAHSRIYDRLLSMCVPVRFTGDNFRQETAQRKMESMKKLITD